MKQSIFYKLINVFFLVFIPLYGFASTETLIILDQSASMYEPFEDKLKFYYAKQAVIDILNTMDDSDHIGFRTIGMNPDRIRLRGIVDNYALCTATEKLNDITYNNKRDIQINLNRIIPSGTSPIEYVLTKAIDEDFSENADLKQIILVTDGYENCNGDPCGYIRRTMLSRKDIKINVVAIGASYEDIEGLQCLTSATNGHFVNIDTPYKLENSIANITNKINFEKQKIETQEQQEKMNAKSIEYKKYLMEFKE